MGAGIGAGIGAGVGAGSGISTPTTGAGSTKGSGEFSGGIATVGATPWPDITVGGKGSLEGLTFPSPLAFASARRSKPHCPQKVASV